MTVSRSERGRGAIPGTIVAAALLSFAIAGNGVAQEARDEDDSGPLRLIPALQEESGESGQAAPGDDASPPAAGEADPAAGDDAEAPAAVEAAPAPAVEAEVDAEAGQSGQHEAEADEPAAREPEEAGPAADPSTATGEDGIVVGTLAAIDPDAAGIPLSGIEAFAPDLWSGSRRARIEALLPHLPVAARSAAARRLALALLTSPAQPPAGAGEPGTLVRARAERLAAMGARDHALALLERAGAPGGAEAMARLANDRLLAALDYDAVCQGEWSRTGRSSDGYWRRVRVLCQAAAGLIEAATLGLELLHESDAAPDPLFDDTIYAMAGLAEPVLERLDGPTPLRVAAWRLAQFPIPAEAVKTAAPDVLPAIIGAPETAPETRLLAAERAWALGALPIGAVRALYLEMAFSPDERADALENAQSLESSLGRALMVQAIEAQAVPALRAELMAVALAIAGTQGAHDIMAHALADLVRTVPPEPGHGWFSGTAGRAMLAVGDREAAAAWYALATEQAPGDAEAAEGALRLWPLMLLGSDEAHVSAAEFEAWRASQQGDGDAAAALASVSRQNALAMLVDALGGRIDPEVWDRLLAEAGFVMAAVPAPALVLALESAAGEGRLGETVLLALLLLGGEGPAAAPVAAVAPVVSGLVSVGLVEEARALALEAALRAGL